MSETAKKSPQQLWAIVAPLLKANDGITIFELALLYQKDTGQSFKVDHKKGLAHFLRLPGLSDQVYIDGDHVRIRTKRLDARLWVLKTVRERGPMLVSMVGRLWNEEQEDDFRELMHKGVKAYLEDDLKSHVTLIQQKGSEQLVRIKDPSPTAKAIKTPQSSAVGAGANASTGLGKRSEADGGCSGCRLGARLSADPDSVPYKDDDLILSLGEADFSWSEALVCESGFSTGSNVISTSYDSQSDVLSKYKDTKGHLKRLRNVGTTVLHGVDATNLHAHKDDIRNDHDFLCFHFPHTGGDEGLEESIASNRALLKGLLSCARSFISDRGEVHITVADRYPYTEWKIPSLPTCAGLKYHGSHPFDADMYPGYKHCATDLITKDTRFSEETALTHVWVVSGAAGAAGAGGGEGGGGKKKKKKKKSKGGARVIGL